jgi:DUF1680 family protein
MLTLRLDMWLHQYLQQMNQVWVHSMGPNPFATDGPYSNVMGLKPNYPCCTVNHSQGFPKFVANAFVTTSGGAALVQAYLAPVCIATTLTGGNAVRVRVDTSYPFADTLNVSTSAQVVYTHFVRVPEWAKRNGRSTIALNGGAAQPIAPNADLLIEVAVPAGTYSFQLVLPADIEVIQGSVGASVSCGPILFASNIFRKESVLGKNSVCSPCIYAHSSLKPHVD